MTGRPKCDAEIAALTKAGKTAPQIAEQLGITARTVTRARVRLGIAQPARPMLTGKQIAAAFALLEDGCSYKEAARTVGTSISALSNRFPDHGWTRRQGGEFGAMIRWARQ